ncbi:chaperonin CPN60-like 2, mitochondrial isoform X3 [Quercus robur]|uniref:chaperonin CPN60-like 2, mitochondrial isoform X3 n=1 Tax=Quercus robur TaxID=38942 RepID=UPI0021615A59|nr:chaperonin CPN60-like 2, mitochondrial isoform X3 [Quercus robur]
MHRIVSKLASSITSSTSRKVVCSRVVCNRNYGAKAINFGVGARAAMLQGVSEVAEAVKVTMGPKGRNVIIERSHKDPQVTKDGVTVAKSISFKEKAKNVGADLVKQVAIATNTAAGDGTTCATVLTQAILMEGCKSVAAGVNVMDLRSGINMAVDAVLSDLKSKALMISTSEEIKQVATISANGESEIGDLIARAMEKVGKEGVITVADGNTMDNELEVVEGMKLARGYISPYFVTDHKTQKCELENPLILIYDKKISDMNSLVRILELAVQKKRALLVVAEDVESDALSMLVLNKHHAGLKVCAIKAPGFGENRRANLDDLAILTGGEVITEDRGLTLDKVQFEMLGTAKKVSVSLDDTIILHGGGDKKLIEERCAEAPAFTIASNAGFDGALVIGKLLEQDNHNLGFDAAKGVYVDMVEERIIDPLKVVRTALVDAASISLLLTTSEATVFDHPNEKNKSPSRMPNMDQMSY